MIDSAEEFIRLRNSNDPAEYGRSAHEEAPLEVWWTLVREHPDMKQWVITNKMVPLEVLEHLSHDVDSDIRYFVAQKRKLPHAVMERLARDPDSGVRDRIAWNAKTPRHVLELLRDDPEEEIAEKARERLAE